MDLLDGIVFEDKPNLGVVLEDLSQDVVGLAAHRAFKIGKLDHLHGGVRLSQPDALRKTISPPFQKDRALFRRTNHQCRLKELSTNDEPGRHECAGNQNPREKKLRSTPHATPLGMPAG